MSDMDTWIISAAAVLISVASICTSAYSMRIQRKIDRLRKNR